MTLHTYRALFIAVGMIAVVGIGMGRVASANHSWSGYHWARTTNPFTLKLSNNVSATWTAYLQGASSDWNSNPVDTYPNRGVVKVLNTNIVSGNIISKNCKASPGIVQVCTASYGNNGWLGLAQIWVSGTHITQGVAKMNDTYFNTSTYNSPAWRRLVMCQEIAHTFGLDHQDTTFSNINLGSCMDYTSAPLGGVVDGFDYGPTNEHSNFHDFEELGIVYAHFDTTTTVASHKAAYAQYTNTFDTTGASEWGRAVSRDTQGRNNVFERDLGNGNKLLTHVFWSN